jgi:hypothetical protein
MYSKIISQADFETIVSLSEAKAQCRVFHEMDDSYLESLIPVAGEMAQSYANRMLTLGSAITVFEKYEQVLSLPMGGVTAVTELILDGTASTDFTFEPVTQKLTINNEYSVAKVTYTCGYETAPKAVKHAMLMIISTLYDTRQDHVAGLTVARMPVTSQTLLDTVRYYGI